MIKAITITVPARFLPPPEHLSLDRRAISGIAADIDMASNQFKTQLARPVESSASSTPVIASLLI